MQQSTQVHTTQQSWRCDPGQLSIPPTSLSCVEQRAGQVMHCNLAPSGGALSSYCRRPSTFVFQPINGAHTNHVVLTGIAVWLEIKLKIRLKSPAIQHVPFGIGRRMFSVALTITQQPWFTFSDVRKGLGLKNLGNCISRQRWTTGGPMWDRSGVWWDAFSLEIYSTHY